MLRVMGRVVRRLVVRGVLLLGLAQFVYYLWNGIARRTAGTGGGHQAVPAEDRPRRPDEPPALPFGRRRAGARPADHRHQDVRNHPVVRLGVRGETEGEFDVVAVVPKLAVPRVGDVVRVVTDPADPARYPYTGPSA